MPEIGTEKGVETGMEPDVKPIPKRSVDAEAEKMIKARRLPTAPKGRVDFATLINWLKMLSPDMWKHVMIYVYRLEPIIKNQQADANAANYIDVITEMFGEDYIITQHGGGKYRFFVCDTDLPTGAKLFEAMLAVPTTIHPPILDIATLDVSHKDNVKWVMHYKAKGLLDENNNPAKPKEKETAPVDPQANMMLGMMDRMMQMFQSMSKSSQEQIASRLRASEEGGLGNQIGGILLEQMKQQDPNKAIASFAQLAGMFKSNDNGQLFQTMMTMFSSMQTMMMEAQKENTRIMFESLKTITERNVPKGSEDGEEDGMDKLDKILSIAERMGAKFGGRSGGSRPWYESLMEYAAPAIPSVLGIINNLTALKNVPHPTMSNPIPQNPPVGNVVQMPRPIPQSNNPFNNPDLNRISKEEAAMQQNRPVDVPVMQPEIVTPGPQAEAPQADVIAAVRQYGGLIKKNIEDGKEGWQFAEEIVSMFGAPIHAMVSKHGKDGILAGMRMLPEFWTPLEATFGLQYLEQWVDEFIHYKEVLAQMEEEEEEPEVIEKKGKKK